MTSSTNTTGHFWKNVNFQGWIPTAFVPFALGITYLLDSQVLLERTPCVCKHHPWNWWISAGLLPRRRESMNQGWSYKPSWACHIKPGDLNLSLTLRTRVLFSVKRDLWLRLRHCGMTSPPLEADSGWEMLSCVRNVVGLVTPHDTPGKCGSFVMSLCRRGKESREKQARQTNQWQGQNSDPSCDQGGCGRISDLRLPYPLSASRSPSWCGYGRRERHSGYNLQPALSM